MNKNSNVIDINRFRSDKENKEINKLLQYNIMNMAEYIKSKIAFIGFIGVIKDDAVLDFINKLNPDVLLTLLIPEVIDQVYDKLFADKKEYTTEEFLVIFDRLANGIIIESLNNIIKIHEKYINGKK